MARYGAVAGGEPVLRLAGILTVAAVVGFVAADTLVAFTVGSAVAAALVVLLVAGATGGMTSGRAVGPLVAGARFPVNIAARPRASLRSASTRAGEPSQDPGSQTVR